jgi:hypothetical protein
MKTHTAGQPSIAVVLKKQHILPLCTAVVESFNKDGYTPVEFKNSDIYSNDQSKPWLDGGLFKEAMHDLLGEALRYRDEKEPVKFSLCSRGTSSWRVVISYMLGQSAGERFNDTSGYPYFLSFRTREIISQHNTKISFETKNQKANFDISFEK